MSDGKRPGEQGWSDAGHGDRLPAVQLADGERAMVTSSGDYQHTNRPLDFYETALWEIAAHGGNVAAAHRALTAAGHDYALRSMTEWKSKTLRNRYHEIVQRRSRELEDIVANQAIGLALRQASVEEAALRQISAGLSAVDATEASVILRNVSQSKSLQVRATTDLKRGQVALKNARTLEQLAGALERLGVVTITEAEVVEEPPA